MGRKELEEELRELRKTAGSKPISKMKAVDISAEIERMKGKLQTTPNLVSTRASPSKAQESSVESIQEAREQEFPVRPKASAGKKSVAPKKGGVAKKSTPPSKVSKKALMKMLDEISDSDEE